MCPRPIIILPRHCSAPQGNTAQLFSCRLIQEMRTPAWHTGKTRISASPQADPGGSQPHVPLRLAKDWGSTSLHHPLKVWFQSSASNNLSTSTSKFFLTLLMKDTVPRMGSSRTFRSMILKNKDLSTDIHTQ